MAVLTGLAATISGGALGLVAIDAPQAAGGDRDALYLAVSGVLVALITSGFALLKDRKPDPPPARLVDEQTTHALPREMSDLLVTESRRVDEQRDEIDRLRAEVDLWQERAYTAGWRP